MDDYESLSLLDFCPRTLMSKECNAWVVHDQIFSLFTKGGINKLEIDNFPKMILLDRNKIIGIWETIWIPSKLPS